MQEYEKENISLPIVLLRGTVLFPGTKLSFDIGRVKSLNALNYAIDTNQTVFIALQKNALEEEPKIEDLHTTGVIAKILQVINQPNNFMHVLVEGVERGELLSFSQKEPFLMADVVPIHNISTVVSKEEKAAVRSLKNVLNQYVNMFPQFLPKLASDIYLMDSPSEISDYVAANLIEGYKEKQELLSISDPLERLEKLISLLIDELEILSIEEKLNIKFINNMEKNKKEIYLREQLKLISEELEGSDETEADALKKKILNAKLPKSVEEKLLKECSKISKMTFGSQELSVFLNHLETCLELPWNNETIENIDLVKVKKVLDKEHFGLEKIKENVLESLAVRELKPDIKGQILCLVGPPGVGKTSIAKSIAKAIGRNFERVSLGGVHDEAEIRGHRKTYIGAMPGRIISAVKSSKSKNSLILLDEIDKLSKDAFGDPVSALLEVLDSEQNYKFYDHYIDMPFDISKIFFITTANDRQSIPAPLLDRMDIIELGSYTHEEKFNIAKKHLIPKQLSYLGIKSTQFKVKDEAIRNIIDLYTHEAGVRELERVIISLIKKSVRLVDFKNVENKIIISAKDLENILGPAKFKIDVLNKKDEIGCVMGLAWTKLGGEILPIEVAVMSGEGKLELTGSLGDVMKESAKAAISYIRSNCKKLKIDKNFYKTTDIHVHVPHGAVPKDGPSAGITMACAIISALNLKPIRRDVAMTGEITLRGKILAIGGLKEKTMAAYRAGIKTVIIPAENRADLEEIDSKVKDKINFVFVEDISNALKHIFR